MKVYFISGLAADRRIFGNIRLPQGFEAEYIDWIKPVRNESIHDYAMKLAAKIDTDNPFIIIGVSIGGILASEISLKLDPVALIIIGSISSNLQLPGYYKRLGKAGIPKLVPGFFYKTAAIIKHYFTRYPNKKDKEIIIQMIIDADSDFVRWGIGAVLSWENIETPKRLFHIHGTKDEIFPFHRVTPTHIIPKGDHVLVIKNAEVINKMLEEILLKPTG
jgi:pimeloyl-ACP methyl ester carboxylesterase